MKIKSDLFNIPYDTLFSASYNELEECLQTAAVSCVPEIEISAQETREIITRTLHDDLKTKEVRHAML